jgi:dipeptidyl aminopeptidase/acylaminoacyl peptidase
MSLSISRYLSVRQAYCPSFASDGKRLIFLTDITGVPQVWQVALTPGQQEPPWPDQLTFKADRVMGVWCSPAPGDGRLIYARDVGGNENAQLHLLSADGTEETPLTAGHEDAMHLLGEWSADGRQILFAANRRNPGLFDLYLQPLDGPARLVWQHDQPGYLFNLSFSPDGQRATATRMAGSFQHDLFEVDLSTGTARQITPSQEPARYTSAFYAPDGRSLLVNTDLGSDFLHVARLDLETLALETLVAPDWDTELLTRSPDGRYLAYAVNVDGGHQLFVLDLNTGQTHTTPGLDAAPGVIGMMDARLAFSADATRLAFSFTHSTHASDVHVWELGTGRIQTVTRSSHGGLAPDSFVPPQLVRYPTFDDRHIPAWFYQPAAGGNEPLPVIVMVHGGPEAQFQPFFHFFVQYLVQNGYAVLAPNVRGSTGYGKAYSHLDDVEKRMDSVADLAYAAHWLKEQPGIDGKRLVVYGGSYGGFMVLAALTTYPDLWAAGVDIVGISNFVTFLENTSDYRRAHREAEYGSLARDREFLDSIAPIRHVDNITAPLMVIHGANDPRVPLSEAEQLVTALKSRGVPVEFLVFDDEGHGLVKLKNKRIAYPAIVDFLDTYL